MHISTTVFYHLLKWREGPIVSQTRHDISLHFSFVVMLFFFRRCSSPWASDWPGEKCPPPVPDRFCHRPHHVDEGREAPAQPHSHRRLQAHPADLQPPERRLRNVPVLCPRKCRGSGVVRIKIGRWDGHPKQMLSILLIRRGRWILGRKIICHRIAFGLPSISIWSTHPRFHAWLTGVTARFLIESLLTMKQYDSIMEGFLKLFQCTKLCKEVYSYHEILPGTNRAKRQYSWRERWRLKHY